MPALRHQPVLVLSLAPNAVVAQTDGPELLSGGAGGVVELLAVLLVVLCWVAIGAAWVATRPRTPSAGPETIDPGPESPAVANLLTHDWRVTPEAVPATLLDLAARGHVDIDQVAGDHLVLRLRPARTAQTGDPVRPYEEQVLEHLQRVAVDGVVPAAALTTGPEGAAAAWWRRFRGSVLAEAQTVGLSRDRWPARLLGVLTVAAFAPIVLLWATGRFGDDGSVTTFAALALAMGAIGLVLAQGRSGAQRDTPAGLRAASHLLGLRAHLDESVLLGEHSPAAVVLYERRLAYAAALGVAPRAVAQLPLGAEDPKVAWSSVGGRWRQVRVRYPRVVLGWGTSPVLSTGLGVLAAVAGVVVFRWVLGLGWPQPDEATPAGLVTAARVVVIGGVALAFALVLGAIVTLVRAVPDLWQVDEVRGRVIRQRSRLVAKLNPWRRREKRRWYVAVDDGTARVVRAWSVAPELYRRVAHGDDVRAEVTPHLGFVRLLERAAEMRPPS